MYEAASTPNSYYVSNDVQSWTTERGHVETYLL